MEPSLKPNAVPEDGYLQLLEQIDAIEGDARPSTLQQVAMRSAMKLGVTNPQEFRPSLLDPALYQQYLDKQEELGHAEDRLFRFLVDNKDPPENNSQKKQRSKRSCKALRPFYFDDEGNQVFLKPTETMWYQMYLQD